MNQSTPVTEFPGGSLLFAVPRQMHAVYEALPPEEPKVYYSLVSPDQISEAKDRIRSVLPGLKRLSQTINAFACDDDFGHPNTADMAIDELGLVLAALAGQSS